MDACKHEIVLRPMHPEDIDAAVCLTRVEGWPHRAEDWAFHIQQGAGWVAAGADGTLFGTLLWWDYGGDAGALGLIVVDRRCQGQGLGTRLMQLAIKEIGPRRLSLVSTPTGYKLYRRFGFEPVGVIEQRQAEVRGVAPLPLPESTLFRPMEQSDLEDLCQLDREAVGADRRRLITALLEVACGYVLEQGDRLSGFAMVRRAGLGNTVGPVVATGQDDARLLLSHLLARHPGFTRIDAPGEADALTSWLDTLGLLSVDQGILMRRENERSAGDRNFRCFALVSQAFG